MFGLKTTGQSLVAYDTSQPDPGRTVVRLQVMEQGIPVIGSEFIVHLDATRDILSVTGETVPRTDIATTVTVDPATAIATARELVSKTYQVSPDALTVTAPELWIYDPELIGPGGGFPTTVWRMEVTPAALLPIREFVLVDTVRGAVVLHFNQVETALDRETYTAGNTTVLPGTLVCNEGNPSCAGGDAEAVAAHTYAGDTYDFYLTNHGRDSIDDAGMTLVSTVHYDAGFNNAFWNGSQMVYGDGVGFALADDVVAHELTHGVTQHTSNLFYYYQSGAINESLSDIWGEFVDQTNSAGNDSASVKWLIGEDITGLGAIRDMEDPTTFGDPDKMTSPNYWLTMGDSGGVHTNSGINNKAVVLMVDGGSFNGQTVTALGITKVAAIYYEVQTNLLTSGADYADLHDALFQACNNLVGTGGITAFDCEQVQNAATAVEMDLQPVAGFNTDAPICSPGDVVNTVFFDDLESGPGNFGTITPIGTVRWTYGSPYGPFAHSGENFLYADDFPGAVTDSSVVTTGSVAIPANAYLHFAHAFGFEPPAWDGGVVEYSTNGGATWVDAGSLFDANGYSGVLVTTSGNPLGGRSAFVSDSHGYISSRLDLSSLAGQNVRFRWRMGLDASVFNWGWWLDDVHVYSCTAPLLSSTNVAAAANGGTATASSFHSAGYAPSGAIDGNRRGDPWGGGTGWNDGTPDQWPDWLQVTFAGAQTIAEVDVFSLQDAYKTPVDPTPTMPFTLYGLTDFEVQYWDGTEWLAVPNGIISGNTRVWRRITFSPLTTTAIRVYVTNALNTWSRLVEVEAR